MQKIVKRSDDIPDELFNDATEIPNLDLAVFYGRAIGVLGPSGDQGVLVFIPYTTLAEVVAAAASPEDED